MAEHKINKQDVINYLKTLPKGEKLPPLRMIQAQLGGGSLATISAGVRAFVEETHAPAKTAAMPADFGKIANAALVELWAAAVEAHKTLLTNCTTSLKIQLTAVKGNCAELEIANAQLEKDAATIRADCEAAKENLDANKRALSEAMMDAASAKEKLAAEQAARVAAEHHTAEEAGKAAVLQERVKELEAALATERAARAAAEQNKAASDAALAAFREMLGG